MNSPNNYYLSTSDMASVSPYNMIDIQTNPSVMTQGYHPMVTVEIGKNHYYCYTTLTLDYGCFPIYIVKDTTPTSMEVVSVLA